MSDKYDPEAEARMRRDISPLELAKLAAALHPEACRNGDVAETLLAAWALFVRSSALCERFTRLSELEQLEQLSQMALAGSRGAARLLETLGEAAFKRDVPMLVLSARDTESDQLRDYLREKANFERSPQRQAWGSPRTVLDNFRSMFVHRANEHNQRNAAEIFAHEKATKNTSGSAGSTTWVPECAVWRDGDAEYKACKGKWAVTERGKVVEYRIPKDVVDAMISWKRHIRTVPGGKKSVRPLSREDVFIAPAKKKNPKARK